MAPGSTSARDVAGAGPGGRALRLCIVQPGLPHYRIPFFELLGRQEGLELTVWADLEAAGPDARARAGRVQHFTAAAAPIRRIGPLLSQPGQLEAVRCGAFDVVVLSWNLRFLELGRALATAQRRGVRTIVWGHGYSKAEHGIKRRLRNRLARGADAAVLYSRTVADALGGEGVKHAFVAPNAIDQAPIQAASAAWLSDGARLEAFRRDHRLDGREVLVYISRLVGEKQPQMLVEALARVRRRRPDTHLVIIGDGPQRVAVEQTITRLGLSDCVTLTGALFDEADIAPWCLCGHVFPYPTNLGLSLLHAFGYGMPVITSDRPTDHGPEIEALQPGENGLLYRAGDVDDLADKIDCLLADDEGRHRMAEQARATVTGPGGYTLEAMVRGFRQAIESVTT